jgi:hypothetical protein
MKTSVALLIFNPPDTTEKVFEAIRQAKPRLCTLLKFRRFMVLLYVLFYFSSKAGSKQGFSHSN